MRPVGFSENLMEAKSGRKCAEQKLEQPKREYFIPQRLTTSA
jgi:hypothetical protein